MFVVCLFVSNVTGNSYRCNCFPSCLLFVCLFVSCNCFPSRR